MKKKRKYTKRGRPRAYPPPKVIITPKDLKKFAVIAHSIENWGKEKAKRMVGALYALYG